MQPHILGAPAARRPPLDHRLPRQSVVPWCRRGCSSSCLQSAEEGWRVLPRVGRVGGGPRGCPMRPCKAHPHLLAPRQAAPVGQTQQAGPSQPAQAAQRPANAPALSGLQPQGRATAFLLEPAFGFRRPGSRVSGAGFGARNRATGGRPLAVSGGRRGFSEFWKRGQAPAAAVCRCAASNCACIHPSAPPATSRLKRRPGFLCSPLKKGALAAPASASCSTLKHLQLCAPKIPAA